MPTWWTGLPDKRPATTSKPSVKASPRFYGFGLLAEAAQLSEPTVVTETETQNETATGKPVERRRLAAPPQPDAAWSGVTIGPNRIRSVTIAIAARQIQGSRISRTGSA